MGPSCRLLPHGGYALIPTVLTSMAWFASIFQDGCDYAIIEGPVVQAITDDDDTVPWVEAGYAGFRTPLYNSLEDAWDITYTGQCLDYNMDKVTLDAAWNAGKAFAFLALVMGGGGTLFLWFSVCCVFSKATWRFAGYEVLLAAIFQAMAFLWFLNSMCTHRNTCSLSWGSKGDVAACALWALAALSILVYYPSPKVPSDALRQQQQRETTNPEISITGLVDQYPYDSATAATSPASQISSTYSHIAAGLPLEGDATATFLASPKKHRLSPKKPSSSGHLKNVEVL
ncbi:expressed unknown protein [Seminavis robusta]|uniref:Uncharacterized protein n=1 Tax=Seminavis robusta TaxID=568900 RepID=A0A9N8ECH6_9STRA|nr:expressed unknown protein [Seminavis robusta]|eukprot:Sro753_g197460.1 n/a (286) ;mRNA; f:43050-43907